MMEDGVIPRTTAEGRTVDTNRVSSEQNAADNNDPKRLSAQDEKGVSNSYLTEERLIV